MAAMHRSSACMLVKLAGSKPAKAGKNNVKSSFFKLKPNAKASGEFVDTSRKT